MELNLLRLFLVSFLSIGCLVLRPFGLAPPWSAAMGAVGGCAVIALELRLRAMSAGRLLGAVIGGALGVFGALLFGLVVRGGVMRGPSQSWLQIFVLILMSYVGLVVGASKGDLIKVDAPGGVASAEVAPERTMKLLDTSAIIDGRIADMAETGFLDGPLGVTEFVLVELQLVADSSDGGKRQRGRRGLDVVQRMQQNPALGVEILKQDVAGIRAVDLKLIELAKKLPAKIVTTDFNLNKLAQVHGVAVLNINDLANALKPVVMPGERMSLYILKEGKEFNQGVGYLDDGTMVVVDHARKWIGKSVEISVTSVLQTPSGKMIFGKSDGAGRIETSNGRNEEQAAHGENVRAMEGHQPRPITS